MQCSQCNKINDQDAGFCQECGKPLNSAETTRSRRSYLFMFILVPVLALVAGVGYYKFILPSGIAAVVNGEEITAAELDAAVVRAQGSTELASGRVRQQSLNQLIMERIVLQEARKAGVSVKEEDISSAAAVLQRSTGLDDSSFKKYITGQYGSSRFFKAALARRLLMNKYLSENIVPAGADPQVVRMTVDRWIQVQAGKAVVRVSLAEQGTDAGCGNCEPAQKKACGMTNAECGGCDQPMNKPCGMAGGRREGCSQDQNKPCASTTTGAGSSNKIITRVASPAGQGAGEAAQEKSSRAQAAADAGLRYWHEKHEQKDVSASVTDYGCHMQVDIIEKGKKLASLRYQNGSIFE